MKLRTVALLALFAVSAGACRPKKPPVAGPGDTDVSAADRDRARADSLAVEERTRAERDRAERDRLERERMAREAVTASAREVLAATIFFEYDSDEIRGEAAEILQQKAAVLRANPGVRLRIEGHADQRGSTEYNLALGQRRAEAVRAWFGAYGLDTDRFTTVSFGKERLLEEGDGEYAWSRNRRAEFGVAGGEVTQVPREIR